MPYKVESKGDKFAVVNEETGEVKAERDTKEDAERLVRILHQTESSDEWEKE
jgi:hypothetical protein